jgi:Na+/H+ antiporter NhaD/arsenite permease-like protein
MLIGQSSNWTWASFALYMVPIGLVCLFINGLICNFVYRKELSEKPAFTEVDESNAIALDKKLAIKTIVVTCALLVGFLVGAPMDMVALSAGVGMLVLANRPPDETFANIDWSLLLFFAGLFVVVQGVTNTQTAFIGQLIDLSTKHTTNLPGLGIFAGAAVVASNIFGNVPFVMLVRGWMTHAENAAQLWLVLAMASTFAGNLTLVGSVANLIVANGARKECPLGFMEFIKTGVPSTLATVFVGVLMLWAYELFGWH